MHFSLEYMFFQFFSNLKTKGKLFIIVSWSFLSSLWMVHHECFECTFENASEWNIFLVFVDEVESSFSIPFKACTSLHIASDWVSCSRHSDASPNFGWRRVICRRTVWNESETSDLLLGSPPRHSAVWFHLKCIYDVVFGLVCCFSVRLFAWLKNRLNESFSKSSTLSVTWQGCDEGFGWVYWILKSWNLVVIITITSDDLQLANFPRISCKKILAIK